MRLHSACLTGDVFGSRRCDCGDQLRLALRRLEDEAAASSFISSRKAAGSASPTRCAPTQLQDEGLDTVDANMTLGFDDDERDYGIAVRMLEILGCTRVKLLTNNPAKIDGLAQAGSRFRTHSAARPVNGDNRRYLAAKAMRAGHSLDHC